MTDIQTVSNGIKLKSHEQHHRQTDVVMMDVSSSLHPQHPPATTLTKQDPNHLFQQYQRHQSANEGIKIEQTGQLPFPSTDRNVRPRLMSPVPPTTTEIEVDPTAASYAMQLQTMLEERKDANGAHHHYHHHTHHQVDEDTVMDFHPSAAATHASTPSTAPISTASTTSSTTVGRAKLTKEEKDARRRARALLATSPPRKRKIPGSGGGLSVPNSGSSRSTNTTSSSGASSDRNQKGLRHFSLKVSEIVREMVKTTYAKVADELVLDHELTGFAQDQMMNGAPTVRPSVSEEKNIRRRAYDALNVLIAIGVIKKDEGGKEVEWSGLPQHLEPEIRELMIAKESITERIARKQKHLSDLLVQQVCLKNLIQHNQQQVKEKAIAQQTALAASAAAAVVPSSGSVIANLEPNPILPNHLASPSPSVIANASSSAAAAAAAMAQQHPPLPNAATTIQLDLSGVTTSSLADVTPPTLETAPQPPQPDVTIPIDATMIPPPIDTAVPMSPVMDDAPITPVDHHPSMSRFHRPSTIGSGASIASDSSIASRAVTRPALPPRPQPAHMSSRYGRMLLQSPIKSTQTSPVIHKTRPRNPQAPTAQRALQPHPHAHLYDHSQEEEDEAVHEPLPSSNSSIPALEGPCGGGISSVMDGELHHHRSANDMSSRNSANGGAAGGPPVSPNELPLPFLIVCTDASTRIEVQATDDREHTVIAMNGPFSVHEDWDLLRALSFDRIASYDLPRFVGMSELVQFYPQEAFTDQNIPNPNANDNQQPTQKRT